VNNPLDTAWYRFFSGAVKYAARGGSIGLSKNIALILMGDWSGSSSIRIFENENIGRGLLAERD
jgi:hypothetical protein